MIREIRHDMWKPSISQKKLNLDKFPIINENEAPAFSIFRNPVWRQFVYCW